MTASLFGNHGGQSHSTVGYILAAYDLLVLNFAPTQTDINRYDASKDCAELGRNLLLDIEVLNERDTAPNGELERWLTQVEGDSEGYRKAYRDLRASISLPRARRRSNRTHRRAASPCSSG